MNDSRCVRVHDVMNDVAGRPYPVGARAHRVPTTTTMNGGHYGQQ